MEAVLRLGPLAVCALTLWGVAPASRALADGPAYPVRVSANGRCFVDQKDQPVFWLGTTQWQLFRDNTVDEAETILANAKDKGFAFVQVMLLGVGDGQRRLDLRIHREVPPHWRRLLVRAAHLPRQGRSR